ncbi:hypothetical protein [Georgenia satyanarayanai]|uniref:hypothetical protein n=1 Tax=Georgenia satyanarayanai TaxID=860221 RepID=UPI001C64976C|nr:hypothetical protein [Georgenia satyanarayanai]
MGDRRHDTVGGTEVIARLRIPSISLDQPIRRVLPPGDAEHQPVQQGRDLLTLITCTPLGMNTDRIVVVAERLETPAGAVAGERSTGAGLPVVGRGGRRGDRGRRRRRRCADEVARRRTSPCSTPAGL